MGIRVTTDFTGFDRKFSEANLKRGRLAAANDALQAMNTYFVPMLHKDSNTNLRSSSRVSADGNRIIWNSVYARYQFYLHDQTSDAYTTLGTSGRWDLRLKGRKDLMDKVASAFVNGAGFGG